MGVAAKILTIFKSVTVEPSLCLSSVAILYYMLTSINGIYRKICQQTFGNDSTIDCFNLHDTVEAENTVQKLATQFNLYFGFTYLPTSILSSLLMGAASDIYGRKPFVLIGTAGTMVLFYAVLIELCIVDLSLNWLYGVGVVFGLSGSFGAVLSSIYAYTVDCVGDKQMLTVRLAILYVIQSLANVGGSAIGAVLLKK